MNETETDRIEALIAACAGRDRAAFEALYEATAPRLLALCLRVLGDRDAAEDALQDAYFKVWTHADRYRSGDWSPMSWLCTIARNTAIDRLRGRKSHDDIDDVALHLADPAPGPEALAAAADAAARLRACFETLAADRAAAVRGAYLEGMTYAQLAKRFGLPMGTVRSWLRRGLIALRACMQNG